MKGTVRIIAGLMKGRAIPFNLNKFKDAEITPQKVKGAIFSILGEYLKGKTFIDLFAGSGQIGIEALSRDCSVVVLNEKDKTRFEFIRNFINQCNIAGRAVVFNLSAQSALKTVAGMGIKADIVFLDPPYSKEKGMPEFYGPLLTEVSVSGVLKEESEVIVQHYSGNELPELCGSLRKDEVKKYGSTSLAIYHLT